MDLKDPKLIKVAKGNLGLISKAIFFVGERYGSKIGPSPDPKTVRKLIVEEITKISRKDKNLSL